MRAFRSQTEKATVPHSSTTAWRIPWTEEPGRLQSMGSLRVGHNWATPLSLFTSCIGEGNGNPLQCSCLENPRDGGAWWTTVYGVAQSRTRLKRLSSSSSRRPRRAPQPLPPGDNIMGSLWTGRGFWPVPDHAGALILDFWAPDRWEMNVVCKTPSLVFSPSSWDGQTLSLASPCHTVLALCSGNLTVSPSLTDEACQTLLLQLLKVILTSGRGRPNPRNPLHQPLPSKCLLTPRKHWRSCAIWPLRFSALVGLSWMVKQWSRCSPQDATAPLSPRPALLNVASCTRIPGSSDG